MRQALAILLLLSVQRLTAEELSGQEILARIDTNRAAENRASTSTMIIRGRRGTRTVTARSWVRGVDESLTEYLSPAREQGTKMLKLGDELWTWTPAADRTIRIAGHMLRQSLLGSDISYEDFMEEPMLAELYDAEVTGTEAIDGRPCHVLALTANTQDVAYSRRKLWVDVERYLPLKEERFAKSGKLLKRVLIREVFRIDDRWYPKRIVFKDALKKGDGTELVIDAIEFNVDIPAHVFTKASLRR